MLILFIPFLGLFCLCFGLLCVSIFNSPVVQELVFCYRFVIPSFSLKFDAFYLTLVKEFGFTNTFVYSKRNNCKLGIFDENSSRKHVSKLMKMYTLY